jgi:hypothetical protein
MLQSVLQVVNFLYLRERIYRELQCHVITVHAVILCSHYLSCICVLLVALGSLIKNSKFCESESC